MIIKIMIGVNVFVLCTALIYMLITNYKFILALFKRKIEDTKMAKKVDGKLKYLQFYFPDLKYGKLINSITIFVLSALCFVVTYVLSILTIKITSTAIILSAISFFVPNFVISICVNSKIQSIKTILPSYIVNLRNNVEVTNNIIDAIRVTKVEAPLSYSINKFNFRVQNGINVNQCFALLKKEVNIDTFHSLIDAFKVCYQNGGNFVNVLTKYIDIVSKENLEKAKLKENSTATILTLVIMIAINVFLLFSMILTNEEYRRTILQTTMGHIIINFSILSYVLIGYFVYKIFKMEE